MLPKFVAHTLGNISKHVSCHSTNSKIKQRNKTKPISAKYLTIGMKWTEIKQENTIVGKLFYKPLFLL